MRIEEAITFACEAHAGQTRHGGLPYIVHPMDVLLTLIRWGVTDEEVLIAAICHDVLEDCPLIKRTNLVHRFGEKVASIVDELTFLPDRKLEQKISDQKANYMASFDRKSTEALLIKIADRCCNTCDFQREKPDYAPIYWKKAAALFDIFISRKSELVARFGKSVVLLGKAECRLIVLIRESGYDRLLWI